MYDRLMGLIQMIGKGMFDLSEYNDMSAEAERDVIIMLFAICLIVFIGLCIYHACEKELPADYHNNWRLEAEDSQKVREGKMTKRQFLKNMDYGKYR